MTRECVTAYTRVLLGVDDRLLRSSDFVDQTTPSNVLSFDGINEVDYFVVFSDEFNTTGSTYQPSTSSTTSIHWPP
jgi:hypothetical protein